MKITIICIIILLFAPDLGCDAKDGPLTKGDSIVINDRFGCALDCMDGRTTDAVTKHLRTMYGVRWVDSVTEPGICRILAEDIEEEIIQRIKLKLLLSVHRHGSEIVAIVAHPECAGNPVKKEKQIRHLMGAREKIESFGLKIKIILLWVENDWETVEEVDCSLVEA